MVGTRSSRRRAPKTETSENENTSAPSVVARVQLRPPRNEKQDVFSEVSSVIELMNNTSSTTDQCNNDFTGLDTDSGGRGVASLPTPPSICGKGKVNDRITHPNALGTAEESVCYSRVSSSGTKSAPDQLPPCDFDDAFEAKNYCTEASSAATQETCDEEEDIEEANFSRESAKQGDDPLLESEDPYAWLIQTGEVIVIDPEDTIPLTRIRDVTEAGLSKPERAIQGEEGFGLLKGISSAASQAVVVLIPEDQLHVVRLYFVKFKGLSEENAYPISVSKKWYGVVDGAHRRVYMLKRVKRCPERYKGKGWIVLRVHWQPLGVLRGFSRARNELQTGQHIVDFTVYDVFRNLKQCAAEVAVREGLAEGRDKNRGYIKKVADQYCGGIDTANKLTRQLAGIAVALSWPVINTMGEILNKEYQHAERAIENPGAGYDLDIRLCRNLFSRSTFRGATRFKTELSEEDQLNTLRRLQSIAPQRNYKPVSTRELEAQVNKVMAARVEVEKMEKKLQGHEWLDEMEAFKQMLLKRTALDHQVEQSQESDEILPQFEEQWKSYFPLAAELEQANKRSSAVDSNLTLSPVSNHAVEISDTRNVSFPDNPSCASSDDVPRASQQHSMIEDQQISTSSGQSDNAARNIRPDASRNASTPPEQTNDISAGVDATDTSRVDVTEEDRLCTLEQLFIRAENKNWHQFQLTLHDEDLFDFIYADPKQSLSASDLKEGLWTEFKDERKISEFAKFCRTTLRPGCYCFVFATAKEHDTWVAAFQKEGMKVMADPFMIVPSSVSACVTRLKDLPQPLGELAVVARTPGTSSRFKINFKRAYSRVDCSHSRKFGIIDNVPPCNNPLRAHNSRAEVRPRERHPDLISEIMYMFCSPTGMVLDPFAGALTTGISCIYTQRRCVLLEKDTYCFELAIRRLEKLCRDQLLSDDEVNRKSLEMSLGEVS